MKKNNLPECCRHVGEIKYDDKVAYVKVIGETKEKAWGTFVEMLLQSTLIKVGHEVAFKKAPCIRKRGLIRKEYVITARIFKGNLNEN